MTEVCEVVLLKDLNTVCRICLKNDGTISIFSESEADQEYTLQERIMSFAYVEIYQGDGLPSQICKKCLAQVNRAFKLKAQCENADAWLRQFLPVVAKEEDKDIKTEEDKDVNTQVDEESLTSSSNKDLIVTECDKVDNNCIENVIKYEVFDPELTETVVECDDLDLNLSDGIKVIVPSAVDPLEVKVVVPAENSMIDAGGDGVNIVEELEIKPSSEVLANHNIPLLIWSNSEVVDNQSVEPEAGLEIIVPTVNPTNNVPHSIPKKNKKKIKRPEDLHKCPFCDKAYPMQGSLVNHLREHEPTGEFSCTDCGRTFAHEILLEFHVKTHTADRPYCCTQCGKCFMQRATLMSHERYHRIHRNRTFLCSDCGKLCRSKKEHFCPMLHEKRDKIYPCPECGKKFMRPSTLATHKKRHSLMDRYLCKTCFKPFFSGQELLRHTNVHLGIRPFACNIPGCDTSFYTQGELNRHLRYHKGEKNFQCDLCSQSFYESGHLVNHRRKHTGERPFVCYICAKTFADASKLKRHTLIHSANNSRRTSKNIRKRNAYPENDDKYDQSLERSWAILNEAEIEEETVEIQSEVALE